MEKTPNSFFVIGCESRFQLSRQSVQSRVTLYSRIHTEFANKRGPHSVRGPFPVRDAVILVHMQPVDIGALFIVNNSPTRYRAASADSPC